MLRAKAQYINIEKELPIRRVLSPSPASQNNT